MHQKITLSTFRLNSLMWQSWLNNYSAETFEQAFSSFFHRFNMIWLAGVLEPFAPSFKTTSRLNRTYKSLSEYFHNSLKRMFIVNVAKEPVSIQVQGALFSLKFSVRVFSRFWSGWCRLRIRVPLRKRLTKNEDAKGFLRWVVFYSIKPLNHTKTLNARMTF